ncbi:hypothetical protein ACV1CV_12525 [Aeromonas veronii]
MRDPFTRFQQMLATLTSASQLARDQEARLLERLEQLHHQFAMPTYLAERASHSALAQDAAQLTATLADVCASWRQNWRAYAPMRMLSETLSDRLVLLVYGKVNAGKSSLINYLTNELARTLSATPQGFVVTEQGLCPQPLPLEEGATETTRAISGVLIGDKLALIDTPGLHSITAANGVLAQRFTDSADALIWVTPSTNPGLIHELDALAAELTLGKPLLPVISRSDTLQEQCDSSGKLVRTLVAKSTERRRLQEEDISRRTRDYLSHLRKEVPLRNPVSLSVACAKDNPDTAHGMDELGQALTDLTAQALNYKPAKWQAQLDYFIQRSVLIPLERQLQPAVNQLRNGIVELRQRLPVLQQRLLDDALISLLDQWPALVNRHQQGQRRDKVLQEYLQLREQTLARLIKQHLTPVMAALPTPVSLLNAAELGDYQEHDVTRRTPYTEHHDAWNHWASRLVGGLIGTLAGGPIGGLAGALVGELLGRQLTGTSRKEGHHTTSVIDGSELLAKGCQAIEQDLSQSIAALIEQITQDYLAPLQAYLDGVDQSVAALRQEATDQNARFHSLS